MSIASIKSYVIYGTFWQFINPSVVSSGDRLLEILARGALCALSLSDRYLIDIDVQSFDLCCVLALGVNAENNCERNLLQAHMSTP